MDDKIEMDENLRKIAVKVCVEDRKRRVGLVGSTLGELKLKCQQKFGIHVAASEMMFVLEEDGTEVDDEYLSTLSSGVCLMLLLEGEEWTAVTSEPILSTKRKTEENTSSVDGTKVMQLIEDLRMKKRKYDYKQKVSFKPVAPGGAECFVCFDRPKDAFFIPCGHRSCTVCAVQLESTTKVCPLCRSVIMAVGSLQN